MFAVRVCALPVEALDELRCAATHTEITAVLDEREALAQRGGELADELYPVIARLGDLRPLVIGLRRALHGARLPTRREWSDQVRSALPSDLVAEISDWILRLAALRTRVDAVPAVFDAERADRVEALRKLVADRAFLQGLVLASPPLFEDVIKWLDEGRTPSRALLTRVARYLVRAVTKPTPYGTFTVTALGGWGGRQRLATRFDHGDLRHVVELNVWLTLKVARALARDPELRENLPVRLSPGLGEVPAAIQFIDTNPTYVDALARLGESLDRLIDRGAVEVVPPVADQASDHLAALRKWLGTSEPVRVRRSIAAYAAEPDPRQRHLHFRAIAEDVAQLAGDVPLPERTLCHENVVHTSAVLWCAPDEWSHVREDLQALRRFHAVLDPALPARLALADVFRETFDAGAEVSFGRFQRSLPDDPELQALLTMPFNDFARLPSSPWPRVRELAALRGQASQAVYGTDPDEDGVIRISRADLDAIAADWPDFAVAPRSVVFYGQLWDDGFVVNAVNSGFGRGLNRTLRLLGRPGKSLVDDDDAMVAEFGRVFDSHIDLRTPSVPFEIDLPGAVSKRPRRQRIPLRDLVVRHDHDTDLLHLSSRTTGRRVLPVHTGLTAEFFLPPAVRLLLQGFGATPQLGLPSRRTFGDTPVGSLTGVTAEPRVTVGSVTVSRAQWVVRGRDLPRKRHSDAEHLMTITEWARSHGIPMRSFVRVVSVDTIERGTPVLNKSRKPLYVDLADWFLVDGLDRLRPEPDDLVIFQEALPPPSDAPSYGDAGRRVTECLLEVSE